MFLQRTIQQERIEQREWNIGSSGHIATRVLLTNSPSGIFALNIQ